MISAKCLKALSARISWNCRLVNFPDSGKYQNEMDIKNVQRGINSGKWIEAIRTNASVVYKKYWCGFEG